MRITFALFMLALVLLGSCKSDVSDVELEVENTEFIFLETLEEEIFNYPSSANKNNLTLKAKELLKLSQKYISSHPKDVSLERVYEMAALAAEVSGAYNDAINYLYLAQRNFPKSDKAPIYLFNRARILDDILLKKNQSELAYKELIQLYPNDSLSITMKKYLESGLMNKSEQELLDFFNSKN